jgi:hypothetical protein
MPQKLATKTTEKQLLILVNGSLEFVRCAQSEFVRWKSLTSGMG